MNGLIVVSLVNDHGISGLINGFVALRGGNPPSASRGGVLRLARRAKKPYNARIPVD